MEQNNSHFSGTDNRPKGLSILKYQFWFDILATDDYAKGRDVLCKVSEAEQQRMVNLPFVYEDQDKVKMFLKNIRVRLTYPLHIVASFGHENVLNLLMEFNVCMTSTDAYGCNVFHNMVTASLHICNEQSMHRSGLVNWFVQKIGQNMAASLLMQENKDGLRPMEFAAQQGQVLFMTDILSCKGVYVVEQERSGMVTYNFHDITEYELRGRTNKSPLAMLVNMDKSKLECLKTEQLFLSDTALLKQWIDRKISANMPFILMWFIIRTSMILCYFVLDADVKWIMEAFENSTIGDGGKICQKLSMIQIPKIPYTILSGILLLYNFMTLTLDAVNYGWLKHRDNRIRRECLLRRKVSVTNSKFFTVTHEVYLVLVTIALSLYLYNSHTKHVPTVSFGLYSLEIIRGIIPILSMWSFLYFLQMVPKISRAIIIMQGMLKDMVGFFVLYIIVIIPYIHVFETFMLVNSTEGCIHEFSDPLITSYTLFRMMLNLFDLTAFENTVSHISVLYIMHMSFVFVVSIMMINFLIAVMANSASRIANHEALIQRLNQLALVIALEDNLFWVPRKILSKLKKLGFKCHNDRICLISVTMHNKPQVLRMHPDK